MIERKVTRKQEKAEEVAQTRRVGYCFEALSLPPCFRMPIAPAAKEPNLSLTPQWGGCR